MSGSRLIPPRSRGRNSSRGTSTLGVSTTISRSGLRSGSGSRLRHRRLQGKHSHRSWAIGGGGCDNDDRDNDNDGNIGDDGKYGDNGGGRTGATAMSKSEVRTQG